MSKKKVNPNRILTPIEANMLSQKDYTNLKQLIQIKKESLEKKHNITLDDNFLTAEMFLFEMNYNPHSNLTILKQEILLANTILPDDKQIASILSQNGFTINHLKSIIRYRSLIKRLLINNKEMDEEFLEQFQIYKQIVSKLLSIFYFHFKFNDSTIILNRICEMLITCPELFENKSKRKIKFEI